MHTLIVVIGSVIPQVLAQGPCAGVDCGAGGNPLPAFITLIAAILLEVASGLAVLSAVIGGAFMLMNFGNETAAEKGKKGVFFAMIAYAIALMSQAIISFAVAKAGAIDKSSPIIGAMRVTVGSVLYIMNVMFALMMLFFGFKLIVARGQQSEMDAAKKGIVWSIVGAVVINLSYALIRATVLLGF